MKKKRYFFKNNANTYILYFLLMFSLPCIAKDTSISEKNNKELLLSFSGDIMAHNVNYNMKNYNLIYDDIRNILLNDDLSFGNIEMPVCDELPLSSYPRFNVHNNYLKAAINGGFDVFSFANNHTNDHQKKGVNGSLSAINNLKKEYKKNNRKLYFSGIKASDTEKIKATIIEKNGWKILFLAFTEILNWHDSSKKRVYYTAPNKTGKIDFLKMLKEIRKNNPCDVFILSLHIKEAEYGLKVLTKKKEWFKDLSHAGVDIVWANHPHVLQSWEVQNINMQDDKTKKAFFMYSMGNCISGQRWKVNYENPNYYREYTGDSAIMQVKLSKNKKSNLIEFTTTPILITSYKSPQGLIIKRFTKEWINTLPPKQKKYFNARFKLMNNYLPLKD